MEIGSKL